MKGGPTVVQGTPVGQADMTVPRSFTSGLCDCCNDGKTCLAVWCCSPITTAQLWQYTFGQPGSCLVISVILFALVGVGQILNVLIKVLGQLDGIQRKTVKVFFGCVPGNMWSVDANGKK